MRKGFLLIALMLGFQSVQAKIDICVFDLQGKAG